MLSSLVKLAILSPNCNWHKFVVRQKHKYPKHVRQYINFSKVPKLDFEGQDKNNIIESTVRGSGPGGQSVATTSNAVQLTHTPTGIVVKVHETRSVNQNRKIAQQKLIDALDRLYNGEDCIEFQAQRIEQQLKEKRKLDAKRNLDLKILPRLRQKENKLLDKISIVTENPQNYLDPDKKIESLQIDLEKIKIEIQKEETRLSIIGTAHETEEESSLNNNAQK